MQAATIAQTTYDTGGVPTLGRYSSDLFPRAFIASDLQWRGDLGREMSMRGD